jgi:hypothetical protein
MWVGGPTYRFRVNSKTGSMLLVPLLALAWAIRVAPMQASTRALTRQGFTPSMLGPQFAIYRDGERLADVLDRLIGVLSDSEARLCRDAIQQAKMNGTLFVAEPFHCAVVRKGKNEREG